MELGPGHRARAGDPAVSAQHDDRTRWSAGAAQGDGLPAAHAAARGRSSRVSLQSRPARRVQRWRPPRHVSARAALADLLAGHRSRAGQRIRHAAWRRADDGGGGERRARARHDRLRRDGSAAWIALSVRGRAGDWRSVVHAHPRRLPAICDAGAAVLGRRPRCFTPHAMVPTATTRGCCPVFSDRVPSCAAIA